MNKARAILGLCCLFLLAICPTADVDTDVERETIDGWTYTSEVRLEPIAVYAEYRDNRETAAQDGVLLATGGVTLGHIDMFENRQVAWSLSYTTPTKPIVVIDYREGLLQPAHPYELCVEGSEVVFYCDATIFGPAHQSWVWDFAVILEGSADLNGDGIVDGADLGILLDSWGTDDITADITRDGIVDGADLTILLSAW